MSGTKRRFGRIFIRHGKFYVRIRGKGRREVVVLAGPERWHADAVLSVLVAESDRRTTASRLLGVTDPAKSRNGKIGQGLRFAILLRDGFRCCYCGTTTMDAALHVDHRVSVADGGGDEPDNLVTACRDCNLGKGRRSL